MPPLALAALYAIMVWFIGTGIVLLLDLLPRRTFPYSMAAGTVLFAASLHRLAVSAADPSTTAVYVAFTAAVVAWGWQEMGFFMGYVTGPRRTPAPPGASTATRFRTGLAACLWHELAIAATALLIVAASWGAPNQVGTQTFLLLWLMRSSAKLNVMLGVRNLGESFLPPHAAYLLSFMARARMNWLMPLSLAGGTLGTICLVQASLHQPAPATAQGLAMLATMLGLAVVEHAFLVLPLPLDRLWAWSLPSAPLAVTGPVRATNAASRRSHHGLPALLP